MCGLSVDPETYQIVAKTANAKAAYPRKTLAKGDAMVTFGYE